MDTPPEPKVFISYRRNDADGFAGHLKADLVVKWGRDRVFFDIDGVRGGEPIAEKIDREIRNARVFLLVIGPRWADIRDKFFRRRLTRPNDWVRMEIEAAVRYNCRIVPVLVGGAEIPPPEKFPQGTSKISGINALELDNRTWNAGLEALNDVIAEEFAKAASEAASPPVAFEFPSETPPLPPVEPGKPSRRFWSPQTAGIAASVVVAILVLSQVVPHGAAIQDAGQDSVKTSHGDSLRGGGHGFLVSDTARARGLLIEPGTPISDLPPDSLARYSFVAMRATGGVHLDSEFVANWAYAGHLGKVRGAYHYFNGRQPVDTQVDNYLAAVQLTDSDLPPILYVDEEMFQSGAPQTQMADEIQEWLESVRARTHRVPIVYAYNVRWDLYMVDRFGGYPVWAGAATTIPHHSFREFARQPKYQGRPIGDESVFEGTSSELAAFIQRMRVAPR